MTELQGVENNNLIKDSYHSSNLVTFNLENGSAYSYDTTDSSNTAEKVSGPLIKDISNYMSHGDGSSTFYIGYDDKIYSFGTNNEYGILGVCDTAYKSSPTEIKFE